MDIQAADFDQVGVHRRIEKTVVGDVIDMTVGVIVMPAGGDGLEMGVVGAMGHRVGHQRRFLELDGQFKVKLRRRCHRHYLNHMSVNPLPCAANSPINRAGAQ
jgi:hypothetical protein